LERESFFPLERKSLFLLEWESLFMLEWEPLFLLEWELLFMLEWEQLLPSSLLWVRARELYYRPPSGQSVFYPPWDRDI